MNCPDPVADGARSDDGGRTADPILGLGKEVWMNEDADAYVRRIREGRESESEVAHEGVRSEHG